MDLRTRPLSQECASRSHGFLHIPARSEANTPKPATFLRLAICCIVSRDIAIIGHLPCLACIYVIRSIFSFQSRIAGHHGDRLARRYAARMLIGAVNTPIQILGGKHGDGRNRVALAAD